MAAASASTWGRATPKKAGETDDRLFDVSAWREAPHYTDAERAALALTEAATRLSDRPDAVSDEISS
jgi:alkylhydroperoxidase family enzyme